MKTEIKVLSLIMTVFMAIATSSCTNLRKDRNYDLYQITSLFDSNQQEDALKLYRNALVKGDTRAQPFIATCYMYGYGVEKNETKARSLYKTFSTSVPHPSEFPYIEVLIKISNDGVVDIEGIKFELEDQRLEKVSELISGLIDIAAQQDCPLVVNIEFEPCVSHRRILSVIDACSYADIDFPFFYSEGLPPRPRMRL